MKKQAIILSTLMILITGSLTAQYCPPNASSRSNTSASIYNDAGWNSYRNNSALYSNSTPMQRLTYEFSNVINEGWKLGKLTQNEIRGLERDFENVEREMKWAKTNRNISYQEQTVIDAKIRKLQRNIKREWNDNDTRRR